jgi:hypothetical protein
MQIVRQRKVLQKQASRSTSFRFLIIGLILVGEMTVSFTGGLVATQWLEPIPQLIEQMVKDIFSAFS